MLFRSLNASGANGFWFSTMSSLKLSWAPTCVGVTVLLGGCKNRVGWGGCPTPAVWSADQSRSEFGSGVAIEWECVETLVGPDLRRGDGRGVGMAEWTRIALSKCGTSRVRALIASCGATCFENAHALTPTTIAGPMSDDVR